MPPYLLASDASAAEKLLAMMRGYWISQAIFVAARLGIADHLRNGPQTSIVLSNRVGVPEQTVYRLMRALATVGVFAEISDRTFELTELGDPLRTDAPGSLRSAGIVMGQVLYPAWGQLGVSIDQDRPGFQQAFGTDFFGYLGKNPEAGQRFQEMMADLNHSTNQSVPATYDFSGVERLIDIGGGNGSLLAAVLQKNPEIQGVLFDLPHVLKIAESTLAASGVIDRCELVGGDFFAGVPPDGDVYLLRWILHDYDDDRASAILTACRESMKPSGRLLILELLVRPDDPEQWASSFLDIQMLILLGGKERTEEEFRSLLWRSGFQLNRVLPTRSPLWILEAIPRQGPSESR